MTIVSIKTGTEAELKRIELSDGSLFSFKTCYLPPDTSGKTGLNTGDPGEFPGAGEEISPDEEGAFRFAALCLRAEKTALRLIARAEQTSFGLSRKLERRGFDSACVRAVLARLGDLDIVNDRRFAALWIQSRLSRRAECPRRLCAGLYSRGISRDDAAAALKAALNFQNESALLRGYIEKHRLCPNENTAGSPSLKYLLKNEGFSPPVIQMFWEEQEW
jgi:regulatory protein